MLIETTEDNLVAGMRWIQGTYTKRFNARHHQWGHLFQGRYKALIVDTEDDYFSTVGSYIHLNPARSKSFDLEGGKLSDYKWSSYPQYLRPSHRPAWLTVERTLGNMGLGDNRSGRQRYRYALQKRVTEIAYSDKPWLADERWAKIRRGWYFGSDDFRKEMVAALDGVMEGKRRDSFLGDESKKHDDLEAERLVVKGLKQFKLKPEQLLQINKNDPRKKAIAWFVRKNTSVRNEWISSRLHMGCVSNISRYVSEVDAAKTGELFKLRRIPI